MDQTLVLNATYEPLRIVSWQKAITLLFQGKVEVIATYDREIRGVTVRVKLPSVLRLLRHVRMKRPFADVPFSRANVYARDDHTCQYCGKRFAPSQLTFDHVLPVARGGRKAWDNIVTCCISCNRLKGDRAPEEAGLRLIRRPRRPEALPSLTLSLGVRRAPESWRDYLFWDVAWDQAPA
jgi:5-methylcytosine-specific restriction endonuclease McrA